MFPHADKTKTFTNNIIKKKKKKISLSITTPEDLLTIKLINPAKCWLKIKSPKLEIIALTTSY